MTHSDSPVILEYTPTDEERAIVEAHLVPNYYPQGTQFVDLPMPKELPFPGTLKTGRGMSPYFRHIDDPGFIFFTTAGGEREPGIMEEAPVYHNLPMEDDK